jgi:hypothetical protein
MTNGREDIRASYTIRPEDDTENVPSVPPRLSPGVRIYLAGTGAAILVLAVALVLTVAGLMHAGSVNAGQAAQIRSLNQANARLSVQSSQMNAALNGQNPAADASLVTCTDLRRMGLVVTTGGSVSSVPGTVSLRQAPVRLPGHCARR